MKLQELAAPSQTKQIAKVFESYFGKSIAFESISKRQAHAMLGRVRGLLGEHRATANVHTSEHNPAYLKLVMLEQVLSKKLREEIPPTAGAAALVAPDPAKTKQALGKISDPKLKAAMTKASAGQNLSPDEQKSVQGAALSAAMAAESRRRKGRRLSESEVQQAQVILASQDMVDQVQRMIEQVTSMQFKDLPALVDQIRNEIGYDQATKFNADATASLGGMVQNLQQSKIQLETAMGTVTGQAPVVPGETAPDAGAAVPAPVPDAGVTPADDLDQLAADAAADVETDVASSRGLGRERR